ncbi:MAG TPA: hypothetical protein VNW04_24155 [Puia sp.]|jgi:hypothetical protein|nr:hypothetical protein [Puia sp.]
MNGSVEILQQCLNCGKPLKGRTDKKFCDAGCKNEYNNRLQREERAAINPIDLILKHNRRVLKQWLGADHHKVVQTEGLLQVGFRFEYHTHHYSNQRGDQYVFCYDYGYLPLPHGRCLVVKDQISQREHYIAKLRDLSA